MVSGTNFITGIVLARYLGLDEFGIFALAWIAVLLLSNLQLAFVISPMMSIGPKQADQEAPAYYGAALINQLFFSGISFLLLFFGATVSGVLFPQWQIQHIAFPLALVAFSIQMQDFMRRYFFTNSRPRYAFANDAISYLGQLAILVWLFKNASLKSEDAIWIIDGPSVSRIYYFSAFIISSRLRPAIVINKKVSVECLPICAKFLG